MVSDHTASVQTVQSAYSPHRFPQCELRAGSLNLAGLGVVEGYLWHVALQGNQSSPSAIMLY